MVHAEMDTVFGRLYPAPFVAAAFEEPSDRDRALKALSGMGVTGLEPLSGKDVVARLAKLSNPSGKKPPPDAPPVTLDEISERYLAAAEAGHGFLIFRMSDPRQQEDAHDVLMMHGAHLVREFG
jgi:hypothetical protein